MFLDIAPSEFLLTAVVAVVVIGPKDLPRAMRTMGRWMGTVRRVSGHFRSGIETMIREAEMEEMEKKWREQNEAIMKANPVTESLPAPEVAQHAPTEPLAQHELPADPHAAASKAEPSADAAPKVTAADAAGASPQLPFTQQGA